MERLKNFLAAVTVALLAALPIASPVIAQQSLEKLLNGTQVRPTITGQDTASGVYFGTNRVGVSGHFETGQGTGDTPALSACGTSAVLATGSTDHAGKITVGTSAANACTLTFGTAYTNVPFCVYQNGTSGAAVNVVTVTAASIAWSSALADSTVLFYNCTAPSGG